MRTTESGQAVQDGGSNTGPGRQKYRKTLNKRNAGAEKNDPKIFSFDVAALPNIKHVYIRYLDCVTLGLWS